MIAHFDDKLVGVIKPDTNRCDAAIVFPVFFEPQARPRPSQLAKASSVQRSRSVPPPRHEKRGEHRFNLRTRALPCTRLNSTVCMAIASLAVRNAALRMRAKPGNLLCELIRQQQVVAVQVLNELAA